MKLYKLMGSYIICACLIFVFLSSCNQDINKEKYDIVYAKDGYILLKSKKQEEKESTFTQMVTYSITPVDKAKRFAQYYEKADKTKLYMPHFVDFDYSEVFEMISKIKDTVRTGWDPAKAGVRIYFAAYDTVQVLRSGVKVPQDYMTTILTGTFNRTDTTQNYNLGDLCPPNCYASGVPSQTYDKRSKLYY